MLSVEVLRCFSSLGLLSHLGYLSYLGPSEIAFAFHGINYSGLLSYLS